MSAEVEVLVARYENVLKIPVAAIVETDEGNFCWVKTIEGSERRAILLGDSNDVFTVVKEGLQEGDEVVLNPTAFRHIQSAAKTSDEAIMGETSSAKNAKSSKSPESN